MSRQALVQKRPYLILSVVAALVFYYLRVTELPEIYLWPIKGSACAFLAVYAFLRHSSPPARVLATAMVVAALADMAVEFDLRVGAGVFIVFHALMIKLFVAHNRGAMDGRDNLILLGLLIVPPLAGYMLTGSGGTAWATAIYGAVLGVMAASAWSSTFPRWTVGAGAILFVVSDLLIFAGLGPLADNPFREYLVWPIYFLGQFLMTVGVITTLRKRDPELAVVQGGRAD
ncbi:lysoplasmalogenase family protein [Aurantiacibacter gangjinensis]|uniref:Lysoplasmalogenase n=1 Tax=Aurantiacibacter gangjinensis TaxID=502682 RepID=A0A0G9MSW8_9SPHN|nr:lysoplasmalogenase family protein [Aurantiacibacter gangjinensis]KLE33619.1 hypothetical protein AAW01_02275 [Aurantiacibacter gangjinensis]